MTDAAQTVLPPEIPTGPVPVGLKIGSPTVYVERNGWFRGDQTLNLGELVGNEMGYTSLGDALAAAQQISNDIKPAVIVREMAVADTPTFFLNENGQLLQRRGPGPVNSWEYKTRALKNLRDGDTGYVQHGSIKAVFDGADFLDFSEDWKDTVGS